MKYLKIILLSILFASCGSINVHYDYERETDFSGYSTFNYVGDLQTGIPELDEKRFFRAMDITLQAKGLKFSEEPDILIDVKSIVYEAQSGNTLGVGIGGGSQGLGGGVSIGVPVGNPKLTRELEINFIDAKKDILVWQAISKQSYKEGDVPAIKEEKMQALVSKIFDQYPPKTKK